MRVLGSHENIAPLKDIAHTLWSSHQTTSPCPKSRAWGTVERQLCNASLRLVPRLVLGGLWNDNFIIHHFTLSQDSCLGGCGPSIYNYWPWARPSKSDTSEDF